jgi:hypothetical protein
MRAAFFVLVSLVFTASTQEPTGHAVAVNPDASAFGSSGARLLSSEDAVFMGDRLQTGAKGEAQLQFSDETRLDLNHCGPGIPKSVEPATVILR